MSHGFSLIEMKILKSNKKLSVPQCICKVCKCSAHKWYEMKNEYT